MIIAVISDTEMPCGVRRARNKTFYKQSNIDCQVRRKRKKSWLEPHYANDFAGRHLVSHSMRIIEFYCA